RRALARVEPSSPLLEQGGVAEGRGGEFIPLSGADRYRRIGTDVNEDVGLKRKPRAVMVPEGVSNSTVPLLLADIGNKSLTKNAVCPNDGSEIWEFDSTTPF